MAVLTAVPWHLSGCLWPTFGCFLAGCCCCLNHLDSWIHNDPQKCWNMLEFGNETPRLSAVRTAAASRHGKPELQAMIMNIPAAQVPAGLEVR